MPREGTHFKTIVYDLVKELYPDEKNKINALKRYRQELAAHTKYFEHVEQKICDGRFDEIEFSQVPSVAMARLRYAFSNLTKDKKQRSQDLRRIKCAELYSKYLEEVKNGTKKINAKASQLTDFPQVFKNQQEDDLTMELLFKSYIDNLSKEAHENMLKKEPNSKVFNMGKSLAVVDVSSSMGSLIGKTKLTCMDMAVLMGVIISKLVTGPFQDKLITFNTNPEWINTSTCKSFREIFQKVYSSPWGGSTDLRKTFDMILDVALNNKIKNEDMPETLFIFSDMQFNQADSKYASSYQDIKAKYEKYNYKLPLIVFWNLRANTPGFPVDSNTPNTFMVSGFSANLMKLFFTGGDVAKLIQEKEPTPLDLMLTVLLSEPYEPVLECMRQNMNMNMYMNVSVDNLLSALKS